MDKPLNRNDKLSDFPPRNVARPGLQALAAAGQEWEEAKLNDLVQTFGLAALVGTPQRTTTGTYTFDVTAMASLVARAAPGVFLVQGQFDVGSAFEQALGIQHLRTSQNMAHRQLRPDLVQVFGPDPGTQRQAVQPDGSVIDVGTNDSRLALRVIDIKAHRRAVGALLHRGYLLLDRASGLAR